MYQTLNPNVDGLFQAIATFNVPFTFAKEVLTAAIAFLIYKKLSPMLPWRMPWSSPESFTRSP